MFGDVERMGSLLYRAALSGLGSKTKIHGLGDGAKWIEAQMKRVFFSQVEYLVSGYSSAAAEHSWASEKEAWRKERQELLKESKIDEVLEGIRRRFPLN